MKTFKIYFATKSILQTQTQFPGVSKEKSS